MLGLAAFIFICWLWLGQELARGHRRMRGLATVDSPPPPRWPKVSLVFAARNEGATLGAAVPTMAALDYPDFEIIAVNDRSEDATGAVLDALAATHPRLRAEHLCALPAGWLGKTHALHHGAAQAAGEWILFTDADIHFASDALRRAVAYAESRHLDLLAAVPGLHERGFWLGVCVNAFSFCLSLGMRPWRIPAPGSRAHGSVGAFSLVRAANYRALGGHEAIRLRPDDDIKLGKLFKQHGARCELLHGAGALSVAWYDSVGAMVRGLTKNAYAAADYRWWVPPAGCAGQALLLWWPLFAAVLTTGPARWLHVGSVLLLLGLGVDQTRFTGGRRAHGLLLPVGVAVFSYVLLRSMVVTHWTGGITWRGTHYSLSALKANRL